VERAISVIGLAAMVGLAWLLSENRRRVDWRLVGIGVGLQVALALLVLRTGFGAWFFEAVRGVFNVLTEASNQGASFVFGNLIEPFSVTLADSDMEGAPQSLTINAALAFSVLPTIIVVSSIAGILYHLHVIQATVRAMAWLMRRTLRTSGAETFGTAILVFMGIESMPTLKGYLRAMTRSELLTVMTAFMSTVAANVMIIYATFGAEPGNLLAASLMSAPAAILLSKILVPETETPVTLGARRIEVTVDSHNVFDGAARGASEGLMLALNVGALLIAFVSLIFLLNWGFDRVLGLSFTEIMGYGFRPFAFIMGVPGHDIAAVGNLLGTKTILNEFIAYSDMLGLIEQGALSPRSITIATYALCGFANPGSLGILMAGLTGLVPERRKDVAQLGVKSLIAGTLASFMTACIAGVLA
jgi:CNT family concentrative nucleoside transporter